MPSSSFGTEARFRDGTGDRQVPGRRERLGYTPGVATGSTEDAAPGGPEPGAGVPRDDPSRDLVRSVVYPRDLLAVVGQRVLASTNAVPVPHRVQHPSHRRASSMTRNTILPRVLGACQAPNSTRCTTGARKAHQEGIPPCLVFTNRHLIAIVQKHPESPTALGHLDGIGAGNRPPGLPPGVVGAAAGQLAPYSPGRMTTWKRGATAAAPYRDYSPVCARRAQIPWKSLAPTPTAPELGRDQAITGRPRSDRCHRSSSRRQGGAGRGTRPGCAACRPQRS